METTINGAVYQVRKLTPYQQFHVARRLAPALWALSTMADGDTSGTLHDKVLGALEPVAEILAKMTDADSEYILTTCLSVVYRQSGNSWGPVAPQGSAGALMFDDITLPIMMRLTFEVLKENLGSFFAEPLGS